MTPLLSANHLTFSYTDRPVLDDVSFEIDARASWRSSAPTVRGKRRFSKFSTPRLSGCRIACPLRPGHEALVAPGDRPDRGDCSAGIPRSFRFCRGNRFDGRFPYLRSLAFEDRTDYASRARPWSKPIVWLLPIAGSPSYPPAKGSAC
jgi:hypothetical protein